MYCQKVQSLGVFLCLLTVCAKDLCGSNQQGKNSNIITLVATTIMLL